MATINSGITMRVMPINSFAFSGLGAGAGMQFLVAQHIEAGVFTELDLIVRLHTGTNMAAGQTLKVVVAQDGYDDQDPASLFAGANLATVTQSGAATVPFFSVATAAGGTGTTPWGRYLGVYVSATQSGTGGTTFIANLSIDLVLKGGDPSSLPMSPNSFRGYRLL
jgi:hypothetical protein